MNLLVLLSIIILTQENGKIVRSTVLSTITELQVSGSSEEAYINGIRYGRKFSAIYVKKSCPIAVCEKPCTSFQMFRNCPYCDCDGFIYREPCISLEDCRFGGVCEYYICRYTTINALL
ncbi:Chaperone protein DnaJ [Trichinella pseudospiralis]